MSGNCIGLVGRTNCLFIGMETKIKQFIMIILYMDTVQPRDTCTVPLVKKYI